ncbi:MAG: PAS domain S-box protein, partial [Thermoflexales bacterium]|nr:PAS domain S-box protein [Thermoflexales bacterium]
MSTDQIIQAGPPSLDQLRQLLYAAPDAIIMADTRQHIQVFNTAAEHIFGYDAAAILGQPLDRLLSPAKGDLHRGQLQALAAGPSMSRTMADRRTVFGRHQSGREVPIEVSISTSRVAGQMWYTAIVRDVSNRLRTEADLRDSEARYRGLIESQRDLIVRVDAQGRFTFVNDVYCTVFGKTRAELIGQTFTPLVHPDDLAATLAAMKGLDEPPYRIYVEQRALTAHGWRWLAWEDYAIKDASGFTIEIQAVGRDITSAKRDQEILRERAAYLRAIMDNSPFMMWLKDAEGRFLAVNDVFAHTCGRANADEVV